MAQQFAVVANEALEREWKEPIHPGVHEFSRLTGLFVQKMRQRAVGPNVLAPDYGIAKHCDVCRGKSLQPSFVKPVILAQGVRDSIIRAGVKPLDFLPERRRGN